MLGYYARWICVLEQAKLDQAIAPVAVVISSPFSGVFPLHEGAFYPRRGRVIYTTVFTEPLCRPPVGLGLDKGAARTAAAPQWSRTPAQGVLIALIMLAAMTCIRRKTPAPTRAFTFWGEDNVDLHGFSL